MPGVRPVQEGLFTDDQLVGGRCGACGRHHFPAVTRCPWCRAEKVTETPLSETGTLWAWTAVTAPPPGYEGETPYGFGIVELPEGIRVITRLTESDPAALSFGMPMRFTVDDLQEADDGNTVVTYAFAPATDDA